MLYVLGLTTTLNIPVCVNIKLNIFERLKYLINIKILIIMFIYSSTFVVIEYKSHFLRVSQVLICKCYDIMM